MQRFSRVISALLLFAITGGPALAANDSTPYAGEEDRAIKALSPEDIADLLAGRGWGFAKPAELNGFPGPAHLLELKAEIGLTASQRDQIEALFADMNAEARTIGAQFVAAEKALDTAFAARTIAPAALEGLIAESARLRGQLRLVHLKTHLATLPLLTHHQVKRYNRLRGYEDDERGTEHDGKHRH